MLAALTTFLAPYRDGAAVAAIASALRSMNQPDHGALSALDSAPVWLNSEPLTAAGLRGRVVLVDFWTYSCVNWLRTLPYVRAWHERYRDRGLVVVGVHAPEFGFEHDLGNVRRAVAELGVGYPVVIDNDFAIWRSLDNHYWPAVYLLDGEGRVRFQHFGEEALRGDRAGDPGAAGRGRGARRRRCRRPRRGGRLGRAAVPRDLPGLRARRAPQRQAAARAQPVVARRRVVAWARRPPCSTRPPARSPTASRRATSTWCSRRRTPAAGPLHRALDGEPPGDAHGRRRRRVRRGHAVRAADVPARPPGEGPIRQRTFEIAFDGPGVQRVRLHLRLIGNASRRLLRDPAVSRAARASSRAVRRATAAVYAVFILSGFAFASWASRIPSIRDALDLTPRTLGLVLLAIAVGSVTSMPLAGVVVGRLGTARTVAVMALVAAAGLATAGLGYPVGVALVSWGCSRWASATAPGTLP